MRFSSTSLNHYNKQVYKYADKKLLETLPNLFSNLELFHEALFNKITQQVNKKLIRVKELGSGNALSKWEYINSLGTRVWNVTLTDFTDNMLPTSYIENSQLSISSRKLNLLDGLQSIETLNKQDILLATYLFDSIWFEEDLHLFKKGDDWYRAYFKVNLQNKLDKNKKGIEYFKKIQIEKKYEPFNIDNFEYREILKNFFNGQNEVVVNFPGGLIKVVEWAFNNQLTRNGLFFIADITADGQDNTKAFQKVSDLFLIKLENYELAKKVLEQKGYIVDLKSVHDFIKESGVITPVDIFDHQVMVIKK